MRIIAHYHFGHWSARFDDNSPDSFGGPDPFTAILRLLEHSPARHLTLDDFEPDLEECRLNRAVMVLRDRGGEGINPLSVTRSNSQMSFKTFCLLGTIDRFHTLRGRRSRR